MLRLAVVLLFASSLVSAEKAFGSGSLDKRQTSSASTVVCTKALWTQTTTPTGVQGPCQILGALGRKCVSDLTIEPITHSDAPYVLPTGNFNNACLCNVVAYNLIAACSWCQTGILSTDWVTESQWSGACTTYNSKGISSSVNTAGLVFPQWAFDSNSGLAWSAADASAEALLKEPNVTGGTAPTAATLPANGIQSGTTSTRRASTTTYRGGGGPYIDTRVVTNVIGIVIGVIVGIYALTAIIVAIVYFKRQSTRKAWYGPMAQHYRSGGLPPWQTGAGAAAYSEQGSLLSGAAPVPTSNYPPSSQAPYTPSATPFSQTSYPQTPPPGSQYAPPAQHQQFDYGSHQGYAPQQYQQPQYQQPQYQQPQYQQTQFTGGHHVPGYTGAPQV